MFCEFLKRSDDIQSYKGASSSIERSEREKEIEKKGKKRKKSEID